MTGTSRALQRLGVAGLSAVLMVTGMASFGATAANAATQNNQATGISLTPPGDAATVGSCNPFTATVTPTPSASNNYTLTVILSQPANNSSETPSSTTIDFCNTNGFTPASSYPNTTSGPNNAIQQSPPPQQCPATGIQSTGTTHDKTATCQGTFATPNGSGQVTFGVTSNTPGSMIVQAYVDVNENGVYDSGIDKTTQVTKTWNANTAGSIQCTPATATNAAAPGATHTITCTVTTGANGAGTPANGQDVKYHITAGPDADPQAALGHQCQVVQSPNNQANIGDKYTCTITNNGVTGTDDVTVWVDTDHNGGIGTTEPQTVVHKTWVGPAPTGATVAVTCDKNTTATTTTNGNTSSTCQDPTTDKTVTFTATVKSGVNSTNPVAGVVVSWTMTANTNGGAPAGEPGNDTETLSGDNNQSTTTFGPGATAVQCTTNASGQCSVTVTDTSPTEGESVTVQASVARASGGPAQANGTKNWHNPTPQEARNVAVTPKAASQQSGGAQGFTATVTDRFGNPVSGACVGWTESGPGRLNNVQQFNCSNSAGNQFDTTCLTGSAGTCAIEVTSLAAESGTETVTASIQTTFGTGSSSSTGGPGGTYECQAAAGYSYYSDNPTPGAYAPGGTTPNANGANNASTGAPAGNCTDSGQVTWQQQSPPPPPPTAKKEHPVLNCFSPRAHVLKCRVASNPRVVGAKVKFYKFKHGVKVRRLAVTHTNKHGIAKMRLTGLRNGSVWRVKAHVGGPGKLLLGGWSNGDKSTIGHG